MGPAYLVRYGLACAVARFATDPEGQSVVFGRGDLVVIRTHRGVELGEVLVEAPAAYDADSETPAAPILRAAGPDDLARAGRVLGERAHRFQACLQVFEDGRWPLEPIDVEPLLDERTVLHYLGPHRLDTSGLVAMLKQRCGLEVVLEPVGKDVADEDLRPAEAEAAPSGCGSCSSSGGCGSGSGGGCSTGGCGSASGGCAVKALVGRKRTAVPA